MNKQLLWVGVDVGSTTVKTTVVDPYTKELLASEYKRHNAEQAATVYELIKDAHQQFPEADFKVAVCGSGGQPFAEATGAFFIQEVVANSIAIKSFYPDSRVAIELGGQDAKVIFFRFDEETRQLVASDMRMNGSCAGGTGAFIDQIAELLDVKTEEFEGLAAKGTSVYDISGRCGVFAKTDIQPLLNQGVSKEDIALSSFHAIAKQTIGGLAQGMDINPPVIFEGGPLTFNPTLIRVFKERLMLSDDQIIIPDHPEVLVAYGTALSIGVMFAESDSGYSWKKAESALKKYTQERRKLFQTSDRFFFADQEEQEEFFQRHRTMDFIFPEYPSGTVLPVYLGIDAGSTTTKFVLLDEHENLIYKYYSNNNGDPLRVIKYSLIAMRDYYRERGISLDIRGVGTTGYGEVLFSKALKADYHTVETVAHAEAAKQVDPDVSFILDIGGQDMKAINLKSGIVTGIVLNEACSAGCGSFIETYARSLNIPVNRIASLGFKAKNPSRLGSRCTVFMNSSIITEQKNGKTTEDIMAGLCRSVIENVFTKVVRIANIESLGDHVVVQGGTFKNDAVLRAFEQYIGKKVKRPDNPGEMGAIGIALLTKKQIEEKEAEVRYTSTFIGLHDMEQFDYQKSPGHVCQFCSNNCNRTLITFSDGTRYVTGNRCERGEIIGDLDDPETKRKLSDTTKKMNQVPDMVKKHNSLLTKDFGTKIVSRKKDITIGLPRTLEFFESMPYWKAIFTSLGFKVVVSKKSTYDLFESGIQNVPSDTVCFPAKLAHGHVKDLVSKGVDRIFMPMLIRIPKENPNTNATFMCAIIQGYPMIIDKSDEPTRRHGIAFDHPIFHWYNKRLKRKQVVEFLVNTYHVSVREARKAMIEGEKAGKSFHDELM
ncbi:MAG: acyl-CoA dehydratase activase, partial [Spirochaetia bacterium]